MFLSKLFSNKIVDSIEDILEKENKFIDKHKEEALAKLKANNWKVLSTDKRIANYGWKIKKGDFIYTVTIREVLNF